MGKEKSTGRCTLKRKHILLRKTHRRPPGKRKEPEYEEGAHRVLRPKGAADVNGERREKRKPRRPGPTGRAPQVLLSIPSDPLKPGVKRKAKNSTGSHDQDMLNSWEESASEGDEVDAEHLKRDKSFKSFMAAINELVDACDVVINVLDSRHPEAGRSQWLEETVRAKGKRLIFLLNKIDLLPKNASVDPWITYLEREAPTLPFRSHLGSKSGAYREVGRKGRSSWSKSLCCGVSDLRKKVREMCSGPVIAGVVGYPNVGKSSVVNSLKRQAVAVTGAQPGVTRKLKEVTIDKFFKLIDSPGVLFSHAASHTTSASLNAIFQHYVKLDQVADPIKIVKIIFDGMGAEALQEIYDVADTSTDHKSFLYSLGHRRGFLEKSGSIALTKVAHIVLEDWNRGRIPFFVSPPEITADVDGDVERNIVGEMAPSFDLENMMEQ